MLEPMLDEVVPELGTDFEVPVIFIQGSEDNCLRHQWFDSITTLSLLPKRK